mgnify:CR=1 FL=1
MEELYNKYKNDAAIFIVYVSEAHAADSTWPVPYATNLGIKKHTSYGERCSVASRLVSEKKLTIPCLIDKLDDGVAAAYQAWPDRIYLIDKSGKLAIAGNRGPWGFAPALSAAETWLAKYKATGVEPSPIKLVDARAKNRKIMGKMMAAYEGGDYDEAVRYALKMHDADPKDTGTMYNLSCFQCLAGNHKEAYEWLGKAIDSGYDDADHLMADDDLKAIRDEARFKSIVAKLRTKDPD